MEKMQILCIQMQYRCKNCGTQSTGPWLSLRSPAAVMTALTLLAAVAAAPALSCKLAAVPRYVAPAHLDCVPCEHTGGE